MKAKDKLTIPRHYPCSMDVNSRHRSLFLCGVAKDAQKEHAFSAIIAFVLTDKNWVSRGTLERDTVKLVSCVKVKTFGVFRSR